MTGTSIEREHVPIGTAQALLTMVHGQDMWIILKPAIRAVPIVALFVLTGCSIARDAPCKCPKPIAYDEATLKEISQALRALQSDNVLHRAMEDYENERDDLRFCP